MAIVALLGLILDVRRVNGDTTSLLLRGSVNGGVVTELGATSLGEDLGDSSGKRGLAVVDVANGTDVHVGLALSGHEALGNRVDLHALTSSKLGKAVLKAESHLEGNEKHINATEGG